MPLTLEIQSNRGARIGHKCHEYFVALQYCRQHSIECAYSPFVGNSSQYDSVLNFGRFHSDIDSTKVYKRLNDDEVKGLLSSNNIHEKFMEMHRSELNFYVFVSIQGNENFLCRLRDNIDWEARYDIIKEYRQNSLSYFRSLPQFTALNLPKRYICIHIRCGDVVNYKSRYLPYSYFVNAYKKMLDVLEEKYLLTYVLTEKNFQDDDKILEELPNVNMVKIGEIESFLMLVNCSYLVASRSGFSNLAYSLGDMKVVVPPFDWNHYFDNVLFRGDMLHEN